MNLESNKHTVVDCPACGRPVPWREEYPCRPFCSRRCKDADFIGWADEQRSIVGSEGYDELFSEYALEQGRQ